MNTLVKNRILFLNFVCFCVFICMTFMACTNGDNGKLNNSTTIEIEHENCWFRSEVLGFKGILNKGKLGNSIYDQFNLHFADSTHNGTIEINLKKGDDYELRGRKNPMDAIIDSLKMNKLNLIPLREKVEIMWKSTNSSVTWDTIITTKAGYTNILVGVDSSAIDIVWDGKRDYAYLNIENYFSKENIIEFVRTFEFREK